MIICNVFYFWRYTKRITVRRQVKQCGVDTYGERAPIRGSGGKAPSGSGVRWAKPPPPTKLNNLLGFGAQRKNQICFILRILQTPYPK